MAAIKNLNLTAEELQGYLNEGKTTREIASLLGVNSGTVLYWIKKLGCSNPRSRHEYNEEYFHKIDTKEKAYILGFVLGDSCLTKEDKLTISLTLKDKEILDFFSSEFGCNVIVDKKFDKKKKIFPQARIVVGNKKIAKDIKMLFGGRLKEERHIPIIKKELEPFLLQGFFDAEGCVSFGHKKTRNQFWAKISFTSQLKMLVGIQNILYNNGISSKIYPKAGNACYVIEIRAKENLKKLLNLIYSDQNFVVLHRKYEKAVALRLELGENGESAPSDNTVPSLLSRKV